MAAILIVDDSKFSLRMTTAMFNESGHAILTAESGQAGLDMAAQKKPDLIICDLLMPDMSGIEMIAALRKQNVTVPVIVLTANIQDSVRDECGKMGVISFLHKPSKKNELLDAVADAIAGKSK